MEHVLRKPVYHTQDGAFRPIVFSVIRVPFFLEPHYDENKPFIESNRERLIQKWGGKQGWERQKRNHALKERGREAGIPHFNLDRLTANTMASHRLIQMIGKRYGLHVSESVYDLLNQYYFVDGHSLNDRPRLAKIVAEKLATLLVQEDATTVTAPPTAEELLKFLNGNEGRKEIKKALAALDELGVHGIPKFIVGRSLLDGAAPAESFVRLFRDIERKGEDLPPPVFGDILGISPEVISGGTYSVEKMAMM